MNHLEDDWQEYSPADASRVYSGYQNFPQTLIDLAVANRGIDEEGCVIPLSESDPEVAVGTPAGMA